MFNLLYIITISGIKTICKMIPGIALTKPSIINIIGVNLIVLKPNALNITSPQIILPTIIAIINEKYMCIFFFGNNLYITPDINPYPASSKDIHNAVGKSGGIPMISDLNIGKIKPTNKPYFHPQINPHNKTGICIGHNIDPISGICPVKYGNIIPSDINVADKVILKSILLSIY